MASSLPKEIKELKGAKYNPRTISDQRLKKLGQSMDTFGDLSGVVFNIRTKTLVSGHQRMTSVKASGAKTRIVTVAHKDENGTVAVGHIDVKTKSGITKIPYRVVDWNIKREKAANIAANAHGGHFDNAKLALVLADIENTKEFDIDIVGLDPLTIKSLKMSKDRLNGTGEHAPTDKSGKKVEFQEYGSDMKTEHECPKCRFRF